MVDLNKEIKLSDLFKRREKPAAESTDVQATEAAPETEKKSALKKEIKLPFGRGSKTPGEPKEGARPKKRKEPKEPRVPKAKRARGAAAAPLPELPLMRAFNLLPKDDPREAGRRPGVAQLALGVATLLMILGLGSAFLLLSSDVSAKEVEANSLREQLAALDQPQEEPAGVDPADQQLVDEQKSRTGALAAAIATRVAWDRLLREVSLVLPDDVWLDQLTAKSPAASAAAAAIPGTAPATSSAFTLTGYGYKQDDVAELLARLSVVPELSQVALVSSARAEIADKEVVQFSITATVQPGGGGTT